MDIHRMFVRPEGRSGEEGARLMGRTGRPLARAAVALLDVSDPTWRVLEIGFGPGVGLAELARMVPQGHVSGVDPSTVMHRHATERNRAAIGAGRITLHRSTADDLPLPDDSVDAAMMLDNLHFWPEPHVGLIELARVLRPGGPVVCGFSPPSGGPPSGLVSLFEEAGFAEVSPNSHTAGRLLRAIKPA